jgi:tetratricopeptide (TPR) repeat protein
MANIVQHAGDPQAAARASFLRGLIADARGDAPGLAAARQALDPKADSEQAADALELEARQQLRLRNFPTARADAEQAATLRRDLPDYRGLARNLALAAQAAKAQGDIQAASDLYLRAGRSAAVQGDTDDARIWLQRAQSGDPEQARQILASLAP